MAGSRPDERERDAVAVQHIRVTAVSERRARGGSADE